MYEKPILYTATDQLAKNLSWVNIKEARTKSEEVLLKPCSILILKSLFQLTRLLHELGHLQKVYVHAVGIVFQGNSINVFM